MIEQKFPKVPHLFLDGQSVIDGVGVFRLQGDRISIDPQEGQYLMRAPGEKDSDLLCRILARMIDQLEHSASEARILLEEVQECRYFIHGIEK